MEIQVQNRKKQTKIQNKIMQKKASLILDALGYKDVELSIVITDDEDIKNLNKEFRQIDKATNVLSFPVNDEDSSFMPFLSVLGDIVISEDTAGKEALEGKITLDQRISQLLVHGILHLIGYDHEISRDEEEKMTQKSIELLSVIEKDKDLSWWI
ncbi:MAG: rRNA maturation RNase YbeY [Thermodesulfobacteriota bacterium]